MRFRAESSLISVWSNQWNFGHQCSASYSVVVSQRVGCCAYRLLLLLVFTATVASCSTSSSSSSVAEDPADKVLSEPEVTLDSAVTKTLGFEGITYTMRGRSSIPLTFTHGDSITQWGIFDRTRGEGRGETVIERSEADFEYFRYLIENGALEDVEFLEFDAIKFTHVFVDEVLWSVMTAGPQTGVWTGHPDLATGMVDGGTYLAGLHEALLGEPVETVSDGKLVYSADLDADNVALMVGTGKVRRLLEVGVPSETDQIAEATFRTDGNGAIVGATVDLSAWWETAQSSIADRVITSDVSFEFIWADATDQVLPVTNPCPQPTVEESVELGTIMACDP